jgi:CUB/sushi domain-containing protein
MYLSILVVDCGSLEAPGNGTIDLSEGTTFGSTAFYSCDENFALDGNSTRVCLSSGVWSNEPSVCYSEYHFHILCVNLNS